MTPRGAELKICGALLEAQRLPRNTVRPLGDGRGD